MDEIEKTLRLYGLNTKEVRVYIACMQLGTDTAFNVAKKSGIKRSTAYLVLNALVEKSLITTRKTAKALLYSAASPEHLISSLEYRKQEVEEALPSLMALYNTAPEKPAIEVFEGENGLKQIYSEIIDYLKTGEEMLFYGDISHFTSSHPILTEWIKRAKTATAPIREILSETATHKKYADAIAKNANPRHELRFVEKQHRFSNDNAIYGDKLVVFSTQKQFFATVITSKEIAQSYRTMFDLAWEAAGAKA